MIELNASLYALKQEIVADPLSRGYASMTAAQIAADLSDPRYGYRIERFVTDRSLVAMFGPRALVVLGSMAACPDPLIAWTYTQLTQRQNDPPGLDAGNAMTQDMLITLGGTGIVDLSKAEAVEIASLGVALESRSQQIGYNEITAQMVERCREVM